MPSERLDAHRRDDARGARQALRIEHRQRADGGHLLRAVEQRQALLGLELERLQAGRVRGRWRRRMRSPPNSASPRPISGSARWASGARSPDAPTRALLGHDRMDAQRAGSPAAARRARGGSRSGRAPACWRAGAASPAPSRGRGAGADAHGVADQEVLLEVRRVRGLDAPVGQVAEARSSRRRRPRRTLRSTSIDRRLASHPPARRGSRVACAPCRATASTASSVRSWPVRTTGDAVGTSAGYGSERRRRSVRFRGAASVPGAPASPAGGRRR